MNRSYQILISKLDHFIKRYYLYEILKGFFISIALILLFFLVESIIEYYSYTSVFVRKFLFFTTVFIFIFLIAYYLLRPLLALFKITHSINRKQAARIIAAHFPDLQDKLLNTIELGEDLSSNSNHHLLLASIEQRTHQLNPLPFKIALPFATLKKSFYYFIAVFALLLLVFFLSPTVLSEGSLRIIHYDKVYHKPAPFVFKFINYQQYIKRGEVCPVQLSVQGDYIPQQVYISIADNLFLMQRSSSRKNIFTFDIKNLNNSIDLYFTADGYNSESYKIEVLPSPILKNFTVDVFPPLYTGISKFSLNNSGDLNIPSGSKVKWTFQTGHTDSVYFVHDSIQTACDRVEDYFIFQGNFYKSLSYSFRLSNRYFSDLKDINYQISIIPDLYPEIQKQELEDSLHIASYYYMIHLRDDYGFSKLTFNYRRVDEFDTSKLTTVNVPIVKRQINQDVFFYFDFSKIELPFSTSSIEYYFEIFDNDYLSGYKSTKTPLSVYKPLSIDQQRHKIDEYSDETQDYIQQSKKLLSEINNDIRNFRKRELNNKLSEWDKKNFVKNIHEKQNQLNNLLEKIKQKNSQKNNLDNQLYQKNQEILNIQNEIQKILDQLMDEELKQLLKELDELQNKFDDKLFNQLRQKMDLSYEDLDKNLDKTLELLKRFQVEEKIQNLSEDLMRLAQRQESLKNKNYKKSDKERKRVEQNSIRNSLNKYQKDFEDVLKQNSELKSPYHIQDMKQDFQDIQQKLDELQNDMDKKSSKKIKEKQDKVADKMKNLSKKMEQMLQEMNAMSMTMNMEDLRQIIDNLNTFSFAQEDVYSLLKSTYATDPLYNQLVNRQNKLQKDFIIIQDSLNALSARILQMSQLINKQLKNINYSMKKSLDEFENLHRRAVMKQQRNIINATNILALYLDELKDQLQNQMSQSGSGKGKQQMPKNAMQKLKQQQQNLKQQLEQLLDALKKSGGKKNGDVNKQIVKSLAEQEIFNKMLKEMQNSKGLNPDAVQQLKEIKQLSDKNINDLINQKLSNELIRRNNQIKTRLLEAENAERKREKDNKRESKQAKDIQRKFPDEIEHFLMEKLKYKETLQKNNLNLNLFYKNLSKDYYQRIK